MFPLHQLTLPLLPSLSGSGHVNWLRTSQPLEAIYPRARITFTTNATLTSIVSCFALNHGRASSNLLSVILCCKYHSVIHLHDRVLGKLRAGMILIIDALIGSIEDNPAPYTRSRSLPWPSNLKFRGGKIGQFCPRPEFRGCCVTALSRVTG